MSLQVTVPPTITWNVVFDGPSAQQYSAHTPCVYVGRGEGLCVYVEEDNEDDDAIHMHANSK